MIRRRNRVTLRFSDEEFAKWGELKGKWYETWTWTDLIHHALRQLRREYDSRPSHIAPGLQPIPSDTRSRVGQQDLLADSMSPNQDLNSLSDTKGRPANEKKKEMHASKKRGPVLASTGIPPIHRGGRKVKQPGQRPGRHTGQKEKNSTRKKKGV